MMREEEIIRQIDLYLRGKLSEEEIDQLWVEFLKNPEYMELFQIEAGARYYYAGKKQNANKELQKMQANSNQAGPQAPASWYLPGSPVIRWGAGIAAAMLLMLLVYNWFSADGLERELIASISPHEMVTTDIQRTDDLAFDPLDVDLNRGYEAAVSGRTEEALERFSSLLTEELDARQSSIAHLNLGILYYNDSLFEEAADSFSRSLEAGELDPFVREKTWWYLANARLKAGEIEEAYHTLQELIRFEGLYQEEAERLMELIQ